MACPCVLIDLIWILKYITGGLCDGGFVQDARDGSMGAAALCAYC